ncbi:hypothetical protein [Pontibacter sp. G13]|uniref:hypothetical protein n=1 Tax=Pontibacter sp. G13 TaxID=3074898 RepID=UPI0028897EBC|nr:hypothetical protein [Pontibacter sp. G13]WNJ20131.1 hypothetical protein RJD25_06575 [Pontibacter sp. G13]
MKRIALLLTLCLGPLLSWGQNALFVDFGYTYTQLQADLVDRDYVQILDTLPARLVKVRSQHADFGYQFHQGHLYKITMKRRFSSRKAGLEAFEGSMAFVQGIGSTLLRMEHGKTYRQVVAYTQDHVYEVYLDQRSGKHPELILKSWYMSHTPKQAWDRELNLGEGELSLLKDRLVTRFASPAGRLDSSNSSDH